MTIFVVGLACFFSAGALLQTFGWQILNVLLLPWLAIAAISLLWFGWKQRRTTALARKVAKRIETPRPCQPHHAAAPHVPPQDVYLTLSAAAASTSRTSGTVILRRRPWAAAVSR